MPMLVATHLAIQRFQGGATREEESRGCFVSSRRGQMQSGLLPSVTEKHSVPGSLQEGRYGGTSSRTGRLVQRSVARLVAEPRARPAGQQEADCVGSVSRSSHVEETVPRHLRSVQHRANISMTG